MHAIGRDLVRTPTTITLPSSSATTAIADGRVVCTFCSSALDHSRGESVAVPSNVRAFKHEVFHIWRCPGCSSLHCLEIVDLARYYANYPIPRTLSDGLRAAYRNQLSRLTKCGFKPQSPLLDYGCGAGLFVQFLRECGYANVTGYDPYSSDARFRDPSVLSSGFDYIVLQDVIEHVEDPRALLDEIDRYLRSGGHVLVGTPSADGISLKQPMKYWLQLHPPYHLHIYTRVALGELGARCGWSVATVYDRPYYDTRVVGLNARVVDEYRWFSDGTLDAFLDPVPAETLRRSVRYLFLAYFGYWFKRTGEIAIVFRKLPGERRPSRAS